MTLILSGTDGLSDIDGSAATPAIRGTDANTGIFFGADIIGFAEGGAEVARFNADAQFVAAAGTALLPVITTTGDVNTGIFFPAADTIAFAEGGAEAMRINSSGNVGIGTSSISGKLSVDGSVYAGPGSASGVAYGFYPAGTYGSTGMFAPAANTVAFATSGGERMRIDSSGSLLVGQTSGNAGARVSIDAGSTDGSPCIDFRKGSATTTTSQVYARFFCDGGAVATGSITANGVAAATFTAYSDRRLKENIVDLPSQLANIMALRPVEFDYIESMGGGHQFGFIAQEVQEVYPDVVGEGADGMLTLADMNKNDARLIKAIQEMKTIMDAQATTITALTARITALETQNADNPPQGETP
jgi:hypothetical protein